MGGLAGHMMHPHDNLKMTVAEFADLFYKTVGGALPMSEKLDGFNIHILNKGGELRFARNAGDLANGGFGKDEIEGRFTNDRVREIFRLGFEMAEHDDRFKMIPDWDLFHYTMNVEIIGFGRTNIMPYGQSMLVPHNLFRWQAEGSKYITVSIDELPGALKTNLPFTMLDTKCDFNLHYWEARLEKVFDEFTNENTLEDYYEHQFVQVVMAIMEGEYSYELVQAMFRRFFKLDKTNLRELRKEYGSENVQKFLDLEKQLVFLTKDDLDQLVLEMGTYILSHFRGLNWSTGTQYSAMSTLHGDIMAQLKSDPDGTKIFVHRWTACKGYVFATEGIVVEYKGDRYKWTGPFAPINQLLGGNR